MKWRRESTDKCYVARLVNLNRKLILFSLSLFLASSFADEVPVYFTYQGRLLNSSGTGPLTSVVDFKFEIFNPSATCLLYEEVQTGEDLGLSSGVFALKVGSPLASTKRGANDPGLTMSTLFANRGVAIRLDDSGTTNTCPGGYIPSNGDVRVLRVTVIEGGVPTVLTPDQIIATQPYATVAQTLQGITPNGFIRANASASLTQANAELLVSGNDASTLHHHDSLYVREGSTSNVNLGTGGMYTMGRLGVGTSSPATDIEIERTNPTFRMDAASGGGGSSQVQFYSGATERARIESPEASSELRFYTNGVAAITIDANQNTTFTSNMFVRGFLDLGDYTNAQEGTLSTYLSTCGANCSGSMWFNADLGKIRYWTGSAMANLGDISGSHTAGGVAYSDGTNLLITGAGTSGQVLVSQGASAPIWSNIDDTTKLSLDGSDTMAGNLQMGSHTITGLATPVASTDAANKSYVDAAVGAVSSSASGAYVAVDGSTALTGHWDTGGFDLNNLGNISISAQKTLGVGHLTNAQESTLTSGFTTAHAGKVWYNTDLNELRLWTGSTTQSLGVVGGSLSSLNGETGSVQTLSIATGAAVTAPTWNSATNNHELQFPNSSDAGVAAGLLSKTDYDVFNSKQAGDPQLTDIAAIDPGTTSGSYLYSDGTNLTTRTVANLKTDLGLGSMADETATDYLLRDGSLSMTGALNLAGNNITNVNSITGTSSTLGSITLNSGTASGATAVFGDVTISGGIVSNLSAPTNSADAANKAYVDAAVGAVSSSASGDYVARDGSATLTGHWNVGGYVLSNATLEALSGSESTPSISFDGDEDTGIFSPGANTLAMSTGGIRRLTIDSTGNVGIGTTTPETALNIVGTGGVNDDMRLESNNDFANQAGGVNLRRSRGTNSTKLPVQAEDNLGGVSASGWDGSVYDFVAAMHLRAEEDFTTEKSAYIRFQTMSNGVMGERLRITSDGNVGIGTISPGTKLHVTGSIIVGDGGETCGASYVGAIRYNSSSLQFCNGSSWQTLGVSGSGMQSLGGQTGNTQTLSIATGAGVTIPTWNSAANNHELQFPNSSAAGVAAGLLSKADYDVFNSKQAGDPQLTDIANIDPTTTSGYLLGSDGTNLVMRSPANARSDLGLGTMAQATATDYLLRDGSLSMTGALNLAGNVINNLAAPVASSDAANKSYVDAAVGSVSSSAAGDYVKIDGTSTMTGNLNLGGNYLSGDGGNEGIYVNSTGNVGIGTTSPTDKLHIVDLYSGIKLERNNNTTGFSDIMFTPTGVLSGSNVQWGAGLYSNSNDWRVWSYDGSTDTTRLAVTNAGNVGIGTASPGAKLHVVGSIMVGDGGETCGASYVGAIRYNSSSLQFCNGSSWQTLGVSGSGMQSLGGQTGNTQTLSIATGAGVTIPTWNSATNNHELQFPNSSDAGVAAGLLSKTDYDVFNSKQAGDPQLTDIANIDPATTSGYLLGSDGINLVMRSPANARSDLGLGTMAQAAATDYLLRDGSLSMTGALNLAGNNIINVNSITGSSAVLGNITLSSGAASGPIAVFGDVTISSGMVTNLSAPTNSADAANKAYVDAAVGAVSSSASGDYVKIDGTSTMTGNLNLGGNYLSGDGGNEGIYVNSSGNVGIGTANPSSKFNVSGSNETVRAKIMNLSSSTAQYPGFEILNYTGSTSGSPVISFSNMRGDSTTSAVLTTGDLLGSYEFWGASNTAHGVVQGATILAKADGTFSTTSAPTSLVFATTESGQQWPAERLRVSSTGNIGIGTSSPDRELHISSASGAQIHLHDTSGGAWNGIQLTSGVFSDYFGQNNATGRFFIDTASNGEDLSILQSGNVGIGTISPGTKLHVTGSIIVGDGGETCGASYVGAIRYNSGNLQFCNGSSWQTLGVSGSGLQSLGGQTGNTQTLSIATGAGVTIPTWNSATNNHELQFPNSSDAGVAAGLLSKADYDVFNSKQAGDPQLTDIANIDPTTTSGYLLGSDGTNLVMRSPANARSDLGLGTMATATATDYLLRDGSLSMTGALNLAGNLINNLAAPVASSDAANKSYVDAAIGAVSSSAAGDYVKIDGTSTMTGNLNLGGNYLSGDGGNEGVYVDSAGKVGIGTASPYHKFEVVQSDADAHAAVINTSSTAARYPGMFVQNFTGGNGGAPTFTGFASRGSQGLPAAVASGDSLFMLNGLGQTDTSTGYGTGALIQMQAAQNFSPTAHGTNISFATVANNQTSLNTRMMITHDGNVGIGTTSPPEKLSVSGAVANIALIDSSHLNTDDAYLGYLMGRDSAGTNVWYVGEGSSGKLVGLMASQANYNLFLGTNGFQRLSVTADGNVGIGTTNPTSNLHVYGSTPRLTVEASTGTDPEIWVDGSAGRTRRMGMRTGGVSRWTLNADSGTESGSNAGSNFSIYRFDDVGTYLGSPFTITRSTGNVGIGTTSPQELLHVNGNARFGSVGRVFLGRSGSEYDSISWNAAPTATSGVYEYANDNTASQLMFKNGGFEFSTAPAGTTGNPITFTKAMTILQSGNVGIGTTTPATPLHVNGSMAATGWVGAGCEGACSSDAYVINYADGRINTYDGSTATCTKAGGSATFSCSSDRKLKNTILDFDGGLDFISRLQPRTYYWNDDESRKLQYGFIAQEVQEVIPHAVTEQEKNGETYLSLNQGEFTPYMINSIKQLHEKVLSLEEEQKLCEMSQQQISSIQLKDREQDRRIANLEQENKELKKENAQIKAWLCKQNPQAPFCDVQ